MRKFETLPSPLPVLPVDVQHVPSYSLQYWTDVAIIAATGVALVSIFASIIAGFVTFRRSGSRVVIHAEKDVRKTTKVTIVNRGRLAVEITHAGLGSLERRRIWRCGYRPRGIQPLIPRVGKAPRDFSSFMLQPGESRVWYLQWPDAVVKARSQTFIRKKFKEDLETCSDPTNTHIHAFVVLYNKQQVTTKVEPEDEPTTLYRLPLAETQEPREYRKTVITWKTRRRQ